MEILHTAIFYILTVICLLSAVFCLFQKSTMNAVISATLLFLGFSGFYFLLNASFLGAAQILLFGVSAPVLMLWSVMMTNLKNDEKCGVLFNLKSLFTPVLAIIFAFLTIPFILYQFKGYKTLQNFSISDFSINLYKNNSFAFELVGFLVFAVIIGAAAVIVIKNAHKQSDADKINGENI